DAVLAYLTDRADEQPDAAPAPTTAAQTNVAGVRITARARELAERSGVDFSRLPGDRIVREADVEALIGAATLPIGLDPTRRVAIYGASQGGRAVIDCLRAIGGYEVVGFLDDTPGYAGTTLDGLPIWHGDHLSKLRTDDVGAIATHVADRPFRLRLRELVAAAGLQMLTMVHPRAYVSASARLGVGCLVKAGAIV